MMLLLSAVVVTLTFQNDPRFSRTLLTGAVVEAAAIWAPYGVDVRRAEPCVPADDSASLSVAIEDERLPSGAASRYVGTFGAVRFTDGVPAPAIVVFFDAIVRLINSLSMRDLPAIAWPTAYRTFVFARVLGRVLAHEIGHVLLQLRGHSDTGLMRARPSLADLVDSDRARFALSAADQARWTRVRSGDGASSTTSTSSR